MKSVTSRTVGGGEDAETKLPIYRNGARRSGKVAAHFINCLLMAQIGRALADVKRPGPGRSTGAWRYCGYYGLYRGFRAPYSGVLAGAFHIWT